MYDKKVHFYLRAIGVILLCIYMQQCGQSCQLDEIGDQLRESNHYEKACE